MLTLSSIFLAGLFVAAPAPTPDNQAETNEDADARARVGETSIYRFEGDNLEGRVLTADGLKVRSHGAKTHESLIKLRTTFLDRLYTHAADI